MPVFHLKVGDDSPAIKNQLQDEDGSVVSLTATDSVAFHMVDSDDSVIVSTIASVTSASDGEVQYQWSTSDTQVSGKFNAEWEVQYSTGRTESFPNDSDIIVNIEEALL